MTTFFAIFLSLAAISLFFQSACFLRNRPLEECARPPRSSGEIG